MPTGPQWVHEIKHDGYRFICRRERNRICVLSRRGHDYTDRVPRIVDTFARLPATTGTLDGEGVACGPDGVTNFELLRAALGRPAKREVFLYAFDLLELDPAIYGFREAVEDGGLMGSRFTQARRTGSRYPRTSRPWPLPTAKRSPPYKSVRTS